MVRVILNKNNLSARSVRLAAFRFGGGGLWRIAYVSLRLLVDRLRDDRVVEDVPRDVRDEVLHKPVGLPRALGRTPVLEELAGGGEGFRRGVALDDHDAPTFVVAAKENARGYNAYATTEY
jgi:hypothetical protein